MSRSTEEQDSAKSRGRPEGLPKRWSVRPRHVSHDETERNSQTWPGGTGWTPFWAWVRSGRSRGWSRPGTPRNFGRRCLWLQDLSGLQCPTGRVPGARGDTEPFLLFRFPAECLLRFAERRLPMGRPRRRSKGVKRSSPGKWRLTGSWRFEPSMIRSASWTVRSQASRRRRSHFKMAWSRQRAGELVAAPVKVAEVVGQTKQEAELLDADVGARKVPWPPARVGGLDERFKNVQGGALNAIAEEEPLRAWKAIQSGDEPKKETVVEFEGMTGFAGTVPDGLCEVRPGRRRSVGFRPGQGEIPSIQRRDGRVYRDQGALPPGPPCKR